MDKCALTRSIISQLEAELTLQTEAALGSREEATDEESRAEDKYDMRSQSAAYLAAGQARLASEIAGAIAAWKALTLRVFGPGERIAAGALVTLESNGRRAAYLMGPQSGGLEARDGVSAATVVTGSSPLGRQLVGRGVGDLVQIADRLGPVPHRIASVE
ncbi:MAG TPA: transcription elongation factor [Opitutaceae bacterium]|nr:transcription elongation factor [Opitutaceae bacterium]